MDFEVFEIIFLKLVWYGHVWYMFLIFIKQLSIAICQCNFGPDLMTVNVERFEMKALNKLNKGAIE